MAVGTWLLSVAVLVFRFSGVCDCVSTRSPFKVVVMAVCGCGGCRHCLWSLLGLVRLSLVVGVGSPLSSVLVILWVLFRSLAFVFWGFWWFSFWASSRLLFFSFFLVLLFCFLGLLLLASRLSLMFGLLLFLPLLPMGCLVVVVALLVGCCFFCGLLSCCSLVFFSFSAFSYDGLDSYLPQIYQ